MPSKTTKSLDLRDVNPYINLFDHKIIHITFLPPLIPVVGMFVPSRRGEELKKTVISIIKVKTIEISVM